MKGTVTALSSIIPVEEAQKASQRVQDTIAERRKEVEHLQHFIADNNNLLNLVHKLPDQLHHHIMVPFGKAAFFPGRLIHTNEFLVLLGEGYYADRTAKQTTEILQRRGKALESQIESFEAVMQDLRAEASFFDTTAAEAAEGLVEIREDYTEEAPSGNASIPGVSKPVSRSFTEADNEKATVEDEEYARILSRLDELEKEELEAESVNEPDKDEQNEGDLGHYISQVSLDHKVTNSVSKGESSTKKEFVEDKFQNDISDQLNFEDSKVHPSSKARSSHEKSPAFSKSEFTESESKFPDLKENVQVALSSKKEVSASSPEPGSYSSKAFTGSIVERTHKIESNPREQTAAAPSKPVSRFKMQRR